MTLEKFNLKKWIVENKHGKAPSHSNYRSLNEQIPTGSMASTGCEGFANIPQDFQDTICQSCENPNYVNMHCECCPDTETTGSEDTTGTIPSDQTTGQTTDPTTGTNIPPKIKDTTKTKTPLKLKEVKNTISKIINLLKEQTNNLTCVSNGVEGYLIPSPPQSNVTNAVAKMVELYGPGSYIYGTTSSGLNAAIVAYSQYGCTELAPPSFYTSIKQMTNAWGDPVSFIGTGPTGGGGGRISGKSQINKI